MRRQDGWPAKLSMVGWPSLPLRSGDDGWKVNGVSASPGTWALRGAKKGPRAEGAAREGH